ncbi:hypothetical protein BHM03_00006820 [Ensete ventricosum]|nr:hypothetical protein BHM03_00006820 [Ensete ventricosum]
MLLRAFWIQESNQKKRISTTIEKNSDKRERQRISKKEEIMRQDLPQLLFGKSVLEGLLVAATSPLRSVHRSREGGIGGFSGFRGVRFRLDDDHGSYPQRRINEEMDRGGILLRREIGNR